MQMQQLNFVSLLLLLGVMLAALSPFAATAHRGLPMGRTGEKGDHDGPAKLDQVVAVSVSRPGAAAKTADHQEEGVTRRNKKGRTNCSFRTRKLPTDAKTHFDGHMPFTADYHSVHGHPPKHN